MTSRNTDETIPWFWFQWFNPFVAQGSSKSTWLGSFCASIAWTFRSAALELWRCCWRCGRFWWDLTGKSERKMGISHWGDWGCYGFDFLDWLSQVYRLTHRSTTVRFGDRHCLDGREWLQATPFILIGSTTRGTFLNRLKGWTKDSQRSYLSNSMKQGVLIVYWHFYVKSFVNIDTPWVN